METESAGCGEEPPQKGLLLKPKKPKFEDVVSISGRGTDNSCDPQSESLRKGLRQTIAILALVIELLKDTESEDLTDYGSNVTSQRYL